MSSPAPEHHESNFVTIYIGSLGSAKTLQATLGSGGFLTFIPQENMKTLDPFNTGANSLSVAVQVPIGEAGAAIDYLEESKIQTRDEDAEDAGYDDELRSLATRIRWGMVIQLMALHLPLPVPLLFASRYQSLTGHRDVKPPGHAVTVRILVCSVVLCLASLGFVSLLFL
jgi:hypothetical protein